MQDKEKVQNQVTDKDRTIFQIDIPFLIFMKKVMQPHQKEFNIVDFFQFIVDYCMKLPTHQFQFNIMSQLRQSQIQSSQQTQIETQPVSPFRRKPLNINKLNSQKIAVEVQQRKIQYAEELLDKLKNVFLWYKKQTISFQMINNYVLSCQNRILKDNNSLQNISQYQNLPQRRVRLDQNVKLCIMPQGDSSRIKFLSVKPDEQRDENIFRKEMFVVTSEYIRGLKVDSQKLAKQGNKTVKIQQKQSQQLSKISIVKNWYSYSQEKIAPDSSNANEKDLKINAKKQLYIEKVKMSQNLVGIITHDRDIFIKPLLKQSQKHQRGRTIVPYQIKMGNLVFDIPDQNLNTPLSKDKEMTEKLKKSKILLFESSNDDIWIAVNEQFVYIYVLPQPSSNQYVNDQLERSSLLSLCEPLPSKGQQALLLTKEYLAIMMEDSCVMIFKLQLSSKNGEKQKNRIYPTNKIYNDIKFICMDYHPVQKQLVFTDFGSYLIRLKFNIANGDIEREGPVYNQETGKSLTQNTTNTRRDKQFNALQKQSEINVQASLLSQLSHEQINKSHLPSNISKKRGSSIKKQTFSIWKEKGTSVNNIIVSQIHLSPQKQKEKSQNKDRSGMSLYAKPQNTDFVKIVKNSSRQNMILLCLNKNNSTLITYEEISINPLKNGKAPQNEEVDQDRLYDKAIKLWDMHFMNVYQTFTLSLQIADLSLQSNGLYIVTKERGYLGFYPLLSQDQNKITARQNAGQKLNTSSGKTNKTNLGQRISIIGNQIFFSTELLRQKNIIKCQKQGYENNLNNYNNPVTTIYNFSLYKENRSITNVQEIPAQVQMQAQNKIYILSDTSGDKRYNLHIYDMLGNKETVLKGTNRTQKYGIQQNYTNLRKINHFQFNILLWNKRSLKFMGSNMEESFTIHWTFSCNQVLQKLDGSEFDMRSLQSASKKQKSIEDIRVSQNSFTVLEKHQNDLFRNISLSIFHLEAARVKFKIHDIRSSFKVLETFNNMMLALESAEKSNFIYQEELEPEKKSFERHAKNSSHKQMTSYPSQKDEEFVNLFDLNSPLNRKCVFTLKYKTLSEKNMTITQIKQFQTNFNSAIFHDKFFIQSHISLENARLFSLNKDDSIIISCIFKLKTQHVYKSYEPLISVQKIKILKSTDNYFLYTREISSEISQKLNYIPRTSDSNVKKLSKKVEFQYVGQSDVHQRILGHWEIDLNELISRSTTKNFNYTSDFHVNTDPDIQIIVSDITEKIIKSADQEKYYSSLLEPTESIVKIYESNSSQSSQMAQQLKASWILAETQSSKSIVCLSSTSFFELFSQQICFKSASLILPSPKMKVSLQKICKIKVDCHKDKPTIDFWNDQFYDDNKKIWQETKSAMVEYMKSRLPKQIQKNLNSPLSISKKNKSPEKQIPLLDLKQSQRKLQIPSERQVDLSHSVSNGHFNSNEINNMFRQWTISKNIEKQMNTYEKHTTETQQQMKKQLKHIIQNPQLKEQRMKYLLEFPDKIRDPTTPIKIKPLSKKHNPLDQVIDVYSILNNENEQEIKEIKRPQIIQKSDKKPQSIQFLQNRLQLSLEKIEKSISLPKIQASCELKTVKYSATSKMSQLKLSKKLSQRKTKIHSSLSNPMNFETSEFTVRKLNQNVQIFKSTFKSPITRTKTETSDRNYMELITETPMESLKALRKPSALQKFHKQIYSPNPQSSLSNINLNLNRNYPTNSVISNLSNIVTQNLEASEAEYMPAKKNKSVITRCKTQISSDDDNLTSLSKSALMQLKQSAKTINQSVLPQIKLNRQKLNEKMKEKKSFLKSINQKLGSPKDQVKNEIFRKLKMSSSHRLNPIQ